MKPIAHIKNDLSTKFGIPRQSGLVESLESCIVFEPEFRQAEALRGLDGFSHLWLLWDFSESHRTDWSPTVRPPRLGGNKRMGVFATRSPFRPNPIGLSVVKLQRIELSTPEGPIIHVAGADLMNGTPIWDIKPYLPHIDAIPDACGGFSEQTAKEAPLEVVIPEQICNKFTDKQIATLHDLLASDPRPRYQDDEERTYVIEYAGEEVKFRVQDKTLNVII